MKVTTGEPVLDSRLFSAFPGCPWWSLWVQPRPTLHTVTVPAVRVAVRTELSSAVPQKRQEDSLFFAANKNTENGRVALIKLLLKLTTRILGLIWRGTRYFENITWHNTAVIPLSIQNKIRASCSTWELETGQFLLPSLQLEAEKKASYFSLVAFSTDVTWVDLDLSYSS